MKTDLTRVEKIQMNLVRRSFNPGPIDHAIRWCQRSIGATWINAATSRIRYIVGEDRLPSFSPEKSFLCVSNHRSFFDMYVITSYLVRHGMPQRIAFPVRAQFFYDHPLGMLVNGAMSFFAMYPPMFKQPVRRSLNLASVDEIVRLLKRGGAFVGLHPEGTRKKDNDPYTLLPAQSGIGKIIHNARVTVLPAFIGGLTNSIPSQVAGNITRKGEPVIIAFGKPLEFDDLFAHTGNAGIYKKVAERAHNAISELGQEERAFRSALRA